MADRSGTASTFPQSSTLHCAVDETHHGPVVACCSICGLLLCEQHLFHRGGRQGYREGFPIFCKTCAFRLPAARQGLPRYPSQRPTP